MTIGVKGLAGQLSSWLKTKAHEPDMPSSSMQSEVAPAPSNLSIRHFSGVGLSAELTFSSSKVITVEAQQSQQGQVRQIYFKGLDQLNPEEQKIVSDVIVGLGSSVSALFSGHGDESMFDFASVDGINDFELTVRSHMTDLKQSLTLDVENGRFGSKKVSSNWQQTDLQTGKKDQHEFSVGSPKLSNAYGQKDYQWLLNHIDQATGVLSSQQNLNGMNQGQALNQYFSAGVHVLFGQMMDSVDQLISVGADEREANRFVKLNVQAMLSFGVGQDSVETTGETDLNGTFRSSRNNANQQVGSFQFDLKVRQYSHKWQRPDGLNQAIVSRKLDMLYQQSGSIIKQLSVEWDRSEYTSAVWDRQQLITESERIKDDLKVRVFDGTDQTSYSAKESTRNHQSLDDTNAQFPL